ncbi:hypothetical protein C2S51_027051 [Perilla frutescens var. frutescens]|nr:hypothetical protein C2S51_027051 [Perilla frutescens var. frutescens]
MQDQFKGVNSKYDNLTNALNTIQQQLSNLTRGKGVQKESILGAPPNTVIADSGFPINYVPYSGSRAMVDHKQSQVIHHIPKIEFPRFDGTQPRSWILKCNQYFQLVDNVPDSHRMILASLHFDGKADQWFQNYCHKFKGYSWAQFLDVVSARFEELREAKIIMEFNKFKHQGSYDDYVKRFEELKACMMMLNHSEYSESYFVASFVSGLSEDLQAAISLFNPQTLHQVIELGRSQIQTVEAIAKKIKGTGRFNFQQGVTNKIQDFNPGNPPKSFTPPLKPPTRLLTSAEMAARREKGLCYNCDEPYVIGHRCKNRISYMIMSEEEEYFQSHPNLEVPSEEFFPPDTKECSLEEVQMSINSLTGVEGITTLRVLGKANEHELHILIDTGSTLSFIQESTVQRLGFPLEQVTPLMVKVSNGQKLVSNAQAKYFSWGVQGHQFNYSLRVLQIEGYDLILGGDWLRSCTPIELDYKNMTFTVTQKGQRIKLQTVTSHVDCMVISGPTLYRLTHTKNWKEIEEIYMVQIHAKVIDADSYPNYQAVDGLLRYKGRIMVGDSEDLKAQILSALHNSNYGGYSGIQGTYMRLKGLFYWPSMKADVVNKKDKPSTVLPETEKKDGDFPVCEAEETIDSLGTAAILDSQGRESPEQGVIVTDQRALWSIVKAMDGKKEKNCVLARLGFCEEEKLGEDNLNVVTGQTEKDGLAAGQSGRDGPGVVGPGCTQACEESG